MTPTNEEIGALLERMILTKKSLYHYVKEIALSRPNYVDGAHIKLICDTIQDFIEHSDKMGLIITTPPRHMKSTICSECLPAWYISNNPQKEVVIASYNQPQARKMARACRMNFNNDWHRRVYPRLEFEVESADEAQLKGKSNGRPNLLAAGQGASLTGSGADLIILDDLIKGAAEANSAIIRENINEWFKTVALTRLSPGGKALIVMTRWHHDDIVGRVLNDNPEEWDILHLPAIDDEGRALWPERYDIDTLEERKKVLGSRVFEALYQGRPSPQTSGFFKMDWIKYGEPFNKSARRVRYWDKAATEGGGDFTVGCLMAFENGRAIIEDIVRLQGSSYQVEQTIKHVAEMDGRNVSIRMEQEGGSSGADVISYYQRNILIGYDFRGDKPTGPKDLRAGSMSAALEGGNLLLVRASWNRELIDEFLTFPYGAHDDQVDACSGAYRALTQGQASSNFYAF